MKYSKQLCSLQIFFLHSLHKGYSAPAEYCFARHANSISHSSLNLLPLSYAAFHPLDILHWVTKNTYLELSSVFSELSSPQSCFPITKVHAYSHVEQNHHLFICSFKTTDGFSLYALQHKK